MSLFGAIVKTAVNVAKLPVTLPVAITMDVVASVADVSSGDGVGKRTKAVVREIKEDADG